MYEMPLSMSLLGFGMGDYVSQLPYVWYYVGYDMVVRNASPRRHMCFRCPMFSFS